MGNIYNIIRAADMEGHINATERDTFGVFVCTSGSASVSIGNRVYMMQPDMLFIYTPYTIVRVSGKSPSWGGIMLEEGLDMLFATISGVSVSMRMAIREHPCIKVDDSQMHRIRQMIDAITLRDGMLGHRRMGSQGVTLMRQVVTTLAQAFCLELLQIYFQCTPADNVPQSRQSRIYNSFMASAMVNCVRERTVAFYATQQKLSTGHFSSIIRQVSGRTPIKWIEAITMSMAKKYLDNQSLSVKDIARLMNFPDQSAFARYFKSRQGSSPTHFRQQLIHARENQPSHATSPRPPLQPTKHTHAL